MRKKTIVIIISFISAFVLMSGGYGLWTKSLTITGSIDVLELPPPPIGDRAPINLNKADLNRKVTIDSKVLNNPEKNITTMPINQNGVEEGNLNESAASEEEHTTATEAPVILLDTDSAPIDETTNIKEESINNLTKTDQEQLGSEAKQSNDAQIGDTKIGNN